MAGQSAALEIQVRPWSGFGGEEVTFHLILTGLPTARPAQGSVGLHALDARLAAASVPVPAEGSEAEVSLSLLLPEVRRPLAARLRFTLGEEATGAAVWVFPTAEEAARPAFASGAVAFVALPEAAVPVARAVGGRAALLSTTAPLPEAARVVVLPATEEVLAVRDRWLEAAQQGRTLLLLGGREGARWGDHQWVTAPAPVEAAAPAHPLFHEIAAEWLRGWGQGPALGLTLPAKGNFRALALFMAEERFAAPLMEWPLGQGWVLACSWPVLEGLTEEPAAASLLTALVRHAATLSAEPFAGKPAVALADPRGDAAGWLREVGLTTVARWPPDTSGAVVIVGARGASREALQAVTRRTDQRAVVLLGLDPDSVVGLGPLCPAGLRLEPEAREEESSIPANPLWWGITAHLLRHAAAGGPVYRLRPSRGTPGDFLAGGLAGFWAKDRRCMVAWQVPLNNEFGRVAFCQLLTNLGAELFEE